MGLIVKQSVCQQALDHLQVLGKHSGRNRFHNARDARKRYWKMQHKWHILPDLGNGFQEITLHDEKLTVLTILSLLNFSLEKSKLSMVFDYIGGWGRRSRSPDLPDLDFILWGCIKSKYIPTSLILLTSPRCSKKLLSILIDYIGIRGTDDQQNIQIITLHDEKVTSW